MVSISWSHVSIPYSVITDIGIVIVKMSVMQLSVGPWSPDLVRYHQ